MTIASLRYLSRSTIVDLPPSFAAAAAAAVRASITALKAVISTGGLGSSGLFDLCLWHCVFPYSVQRASLDN